MSSETSRELDIGTKKYTKVLVADEKGQGNANHKYQICKAEYKNDGHDVLGTVSFQDGPIKEAGVNGVMNENLLAIVIDRLEGFQSGDYACVSNESAKLCIETALRIMRIRTDSREARGVEGTHTV